jgi:hypothetical protein
MAIRPARSDGVPFVDGVSDVDRPRPGCNQYGAGSPTTQQEAGAVEVSSMTDSGGSVPEWGPQIGWLDLSDERRELIKGLYRLAAWVADRPDLPVPRMEARVSTLDEATWDDQRAAVDRVAAALGVTAEYGAGGHHYTAESYFGPARFVAVAITAERLAAHEAETSYRGSVQPDPQAAASAADGAPGDEEPSEADVLMGHAWSWVMDQVEAGAWPDLPFDEALVLPVDGVRARVEAVYAGGWDGFVADHCEELREQDRRVAAWVESQRLDAAREWIAERAYDGAWADLTPAEVVELPDEQVRAGIEAHYVGGWDRFVEDQADHDDTTAEVAAGERAGGAR